MKYSVIFAIILLMLSGIRCMAQDENCEITLSRATEEFQRGHFYLIASVLAPCLNNFTQEQQLRANILLTETYLLLDDPIGAKESFLRILKANPEFVADESIHPSDFVYLSKEFVTDPVFSWFIKAGANTSPIRIIHDLDVFDSQALEKYILKPGYQAALGGEVYLNAKYGIRAELTYLAKAYQHNTSNFFQADSKQFTENQAWLALPVALTYSKSAGKYRPYAYGGFSAGYLLRDIGKSKIEKVRTSEDERDDQRSPDWDILYKRNRWNYSFFLGGGLKIKFGLRYFFVDARYSLGLTNIVKPQNLYTNNSLPLTSDGFVSSNSQVFSYAHVDDYFRIDNLSLSVGYLRPIYKPREIQARRSKFLFFNLNKRKK
jgi:hypothetical protein